MVMLSVVCWYAILEYSRLYVGSVARVVGYLFAGYILPAVGAFLIASLATLWISRYQIIPIRELWFYPFVVTLVALAPKMIVLILMTQFSS